MKIIVIANQKGGVGKTTTAVNLSHGLALKFKPTLLVDLDPQGQSATALGIDQEPGVFHWLVSNHKLYDVIRTARDNLSILPGNLQTSVAQLVLTFQQSPVDYLHQMLKEASRSYDYCVIDTSPSVGGLQERALYAGDLVVIPTACDFLSADAVAQTVKTMYANLEHGWKGALLGVLPTFFDSTTNESRETYADLLSIYATSILDPIHRATILRECAACGQTIYEIDPNSRARVEYDSLVHRVLRVT